MNFVDLTEYMANMSEYESDFEYNEIYEEDLLVIDSFMAYALSINL